jgi:hypothetical protein
MNNQRKPNTDRQGIVWLEVTKKAILEQGNNNS